MSVKPVAIPVTTPELEPTVATDGSELLHVPPPVPLLVYVVVSPTQIGVVPLTVPAVTSGLTVNVLDELVGLPQPLPTVKVIVVVPAETAVTTPVPMLTVATEVLELYQAPPEGELLVYVAF